MKTTTFTRVLYNNFKYFDEWYNSITKHEKILEIHQWLPYSEVTLYYNMYIYYLFSWISKEKSDG